MWDQNTPNNFYLQKENRHRHGKQKVMLQRNWGGNSRRLGINILDS